MRLSLVGGSYLSGLHLNYIDCSTLSFRRASTSRATLDECFSSLETRSANSAISTWLRYRRCSDTDIAKQATLTVQNNVPTQPISAVTIPPQMACNRNNPDKMRYTLAQADRQSNTRQTKPLQGVSMATDSVRVMLLTILGHHSSNCTKPHYLDSCLSRDACRQVKSQVRMHQILATFVGFWHC